MFMQWNTSSGSEHFCLLDDESERREKKLALCEHDLSFFYIYIYYLITLITEFNDTQ